MAGMTGHWLQVSTTLPAVSALRQVQKCTLERWHGT